MRFLKTFLLMVLASAFLVACGGGGGDTGTGSGDAGSLQTAYNAINEQTTFAQVNALVGYGPKSSSTGNLNQYTWYPTATLSLPYEVDPEFQTLV
jgi:hypothetical protein